MPDHALRPAGPADARDMAEVFLAAARAAWPWLGEARLAALSPPVAMFRARLEAGEQGVVAPGAGFALLGAHGEVAALYVHPDRQGEGVGRALLGAALAGLAARGHAEAVLWTEGRNAGALGFYAHLGWRPDGGVRERLWHGAALHEVRLRCPTGAG